MNRSRSIWTVMVLLTVALLATLSEWQKHGDLQAQEQCLTQVQRIASATVTPVDTRHHEATLTDATSLYRVCGSRPQRILPTQGSKTERTTSPGGLPRRNIVKPLHFRHDNRRRRETAPFCLSASCLYYVIALRHIIR